MSTMIFKEKKSIDRNRKVGEERQFPGLYLLHSSLIHSLRYVLLGSFFKHIIPSSILSFAGLMTHDYNGMAQWLTSAPNPNGSVLVDHFEFALRSS